MAKKKYKIKEGSNLLISTQNLKNSYLSDIFLISRSKPAYQQTLLCVLIQRFLLLYYIMIESDYECQSPVYGILKSA